MSVIIGGNQIVWIFNQNSAASEEIKSVFEQDISTNSIVVSVLMWCNEFRFDMSLTGSIILLTVSISLRKKYLNLSASRLSLAKPWKEISSNRSGLDSMNLVKYLDSMLLLCTGIDKHRSVCRIFASSKIFKISSTARISFDDFVFSRKCSWMSNTSKFSKSDRLSQSSNSISRIRSQMDKTRTLETLVSGSRIIREAWKCFYWINNINIVMKSICVRS